MADAISGGNPLEERYSHEVLIILLNNGRMMKTDLLRSVSKSSCMIGRLDRLRDAGLVEIENDTFSNNTKWVTLTPKGEKVARLLEQVKSIMDGTERPEVDNTMPRQHSMLGDDCVAYQPILPDNDGKKSDGNNK